ncbi:MAG: CRISPR-associated helicase Cas3' [Kineosporiaceae bacterium]|nr:CRISPR-associated helicase Cas3' [Kineosporiaceae bacterium]
MITACRIWGKSAGLSTPYPLVGHLLDTAAVSEALVDLWLPQSLTSTLVEWSTLDPEHDPEQGARAVLAAVATAGVLHDLGKATPQFQQLDALAFKQMRDALPELTRPGSNDVVSHDIAGQVLLTATGHPSWLAEAVGGHHGRFSRVPRQTALGRVPFLGRGSWETARTELIDFLDAQLRVRETAGLTPGLLVDEVTRHAAVALITGMVIIADWLVSSTTFLAGRTLTTEQAANPGQLASHLAQARDLAPGLLRDSGLARARLRPSGLSDAFPHITEPRPLQDAVARVLGDTTDATGPACVVITAPMGEGKTEAGLLAASALARTAGRHGVYVALPTQATADQMYGRVLDWLVRAADGPAHSTLLHSLASLNPTYAALPSTLPAASSGPTPDSATLGAADDQVTGTLVSAQWLHGHKRGLLAPFGVGTIDQLLMAVLRLRHQPLRLLGLASKVLLIDEAHAYDDYQQALLRRALTWAGQLGVPVVLMSATLPTATTAALVDAWQEGAQASPQARGTSGLTYPGWGVWYTDRPPVVEALTVSRPQVLQLAHYDVTDTDRADRCLALVRPVVDSGGCVLFVCNTVARAQALTAYLRRTLPADVDVDTLHSRLQVGERRRRTTRLLTKYGPPRRYAGPPSGSDAGQPEPEAASRRGVLVATQVVEQSLDIDFDLVVSDLAPVPLLLQRSGRGHRHDRDGRPDVARQPTLAILWPVTAQGRLNLRTDRHIYPEAHLLRTADVLRGRSRIRVPEDVQTIVEAVCGDTPALADDILAADTRQRQVTYGREAIADVVAVPRPAALGHVEEFTSPVEDSSAVARARLGADTVAVLPVVTVDGVICLAEPGHVSGAALPDTPVPAQVKALIDHGHRPRLPPERDLLDR